MRRAFGLAVLAVPVVAAPVAAHTGGINGYAVITVRGGDVRYGLTLWPATLPSAVVEPLRRARAGDASSRAQVSSAAR